jgi:hypothetical protein
MGDMCVSCRYDPNLPNWKAVVQNSQAITKPNFSALSPQAPGTKVEDVLAERGARYGKFSSQSKYADDINNVLTASPNWEYMSTSQRECLRLIANKIGRILNGDVNYADNWVDIAGYATLVVNILEGKD